MSFFRRIASKLSFGNTLYYPGCLTKFVLPEIESNYKEILNKLGVDFIVIKDEFCCGSPALKAGYKGDFEDLRKKNLEIFKKYGVKKIVCNCPTCAYMFRKYYGIDAEHITRIIARSKKINNYDIEYNEEVSYHDPCHLGRYLKIYNEPRSILKKLKFKIKEMKNNRENSLCCGGGGGLKSNYPEMADKIAKQRLKQCKTEKLITTCPMCYINLKDNADKKVKVIELSEVLL